MTNLTKTATTEQREGYAIVCANGTAYIRSMDSKGNYTYSFSAKTAKLWKVKSYADKALEKLQETSWAAFGNAHLEYTTVSTSKAPWPVNPDKRRMPTYAQLNSLRIINNFYGNPDEFRMLKGILCLDHSLSYEDNKKLDSVFDALTIAERMDDINAGLDLSGNPIK